MRRILLTTVLALVAAPAFAGPKFKTAIVGSEPALLCQTRTQILTYQLNRLNDPIKAETARVHCAQLAPGAKVALIYLYGDEIAGAHMVQVRPLHKPDAKIGYALTSAFSIAQDVARAAD
ncbi:hypothetical protein M2321_002073 [Rhodoblastus acidophilus]|uniref:hypothetical protein n=1 Tax=Rhodoblastus acidophilus TaxID=1074 RepID=UPI0018B01EBE|nr:hypothetical protein [Rhodoblastus acidophilus]MCW2274495.1 hypothetical protein [Rhodoblastus acidophilus]